MGNQAGSGSESAVSCGCGLRQALCAVLNWVEAPRDCAPVMRLRMVRWGWMIPADPVESRGSLQRGQSQREGDGMGVAEVIVMHFEDGDRCVSQEHGCLRKLDTAGRWKLSQKLQKE